jgi:hypothetical protein
MLETGSESRGSALISRRMCVAILSENQTAVTVDATIIGNKRRALEFSANCHTKRQLYVHYESMAFCIDLNDLRCEFQVEESWAGLARDFFGPALAGPGRRCVRRRHVPIRRGLREAPKRSRQVH